MTSVAVNFGPVGYDPHALAKWLYICRYVPRCKSGREAERRLLFRRELLIYEEQIIITAIERIDRMV